MNKEIIKIVEEKQKRLSELTIKIKSVIIPILKIANLMPIPLDSKIAMVLVQMKRLFKTLREYSDDEIVASFMNIMLEDGWKLTEEDEIKEFVKIIRAEIEKEEK